MQGQNRSLANNIFVARDARSKREGRKDPFIHPPVDFCTGMGGGGRGIFK